MDIEGKDPSRISVEGSGSSNTTEEVMGKMCSKGDHWVSWSRGDWVGEEHDLEGPKLYSSEAEKLTLSANSVVAIPNCGGKTMKDISQRMIAH